MDPQYPKLNALKIGTTICFEVHREVKFKSVFEWVEPLVTFEGLVKKLGRISDETVAKVKKVLQEMLVAYNFWFVRSGMWESGGVETITMSTTTTRGRSGYSVNR
jgi:hypothetical protein